MLTTNGIDLNVVGQVNIEGRHYFIVRLDSALYHRDILYRQILVPSFNFKNSNNFEWVEIVEPEPEPKTPVEVVPENVEVDQPVNSSD